MGVSVLSLVAAFFTGGGSEEGAIAAGNIATRIVDRVAASFTERFASKEALKVTAGKTASIIKVSDPEAVFAWTSGQLIYRDQPLSEVAADLSRRFAVPVRTADAGTAALRFSGVLVTDREQDVLRRIEAYAPVRVEHSGAAIVLHRR